MTFQTHLVRRGARYYWRRRIPASLRTAFGKTQIVKALLTSDAHRARRVARRLDVGADVLFHEMSTMIDKLTSEQIQDLTRQVIDLELGHYEEARALAMDLTPERAAMSSELFAGESAEMTEALVTNDFTTIYPLMQEVLDRARIELDPDSLGWRQLGRSALRGLAQAHKVNARRDVGEYDEDGAPLDLQPAWRSGVTMGPLASVSASEPAAALDVPLISTFVEAFIAEKKKALSWTAQTEKQNRASYRMFVEFIGDKPATGYTRGDMIRFREILEKYPDNHGKSSRHRMMTFSEVMAYEAERAAKEGRQLGTLGLSTLERHWRAVRMFMEWVAHQDGVPSIDAKRLFGGHEWSAEVPAPDERDMWADQQVVALFGTAIWRGCKPHLTKRYWRWAPGGQIIRDEYFWLPVLAIYNGARLEENAQLLGSDIKCIDGIWVFDICEDEEEKGNKRKRKAEKAKKLKTKASKRVVPIHSELIRLGVLHLAEAAGNGPLFPEMIRGGSDKKVGYHYTQHFTQYRKRVDLYQRYLDYHSFRATVTTKLIDAGLTDLQAADIVGHDTRSRRADRAQEAPTTLDYFKGFPLVRRKEFIEKLTYQGLDLSHLYVQ